MACAENTYLVEMTSQFTVGNHFQTALIALPLLENLMCIAKGSVQITIPLSSTTKKKNSCTFSCRTSLFYLIHFTIMASALLDVAFSLLSGRNVDIKISLDGCIYPQQQCRLKQSLREEQDPLEQNDSEQRDEVHIDPRRRNNTF